MASSEKTVEEWQATAMLLGLRYDENDHTMYDEFNPISVNFCADTMEPFSSAYSYNGAWAARKNSVSKGRLGAKDFHEYTKRKRSTT